MVDFDYLNFEDIEGNNLLMQSVAKNDLNSIKQLIDLKINLNHHNKKGENALTFAIKLKDPYLIKEFFPNIIHYTKQTFNKQSLDNLLKHLSKDCQEIINLYPFELDIKSALEKSDYELTQTLLQSGAKLDYESFSYLKNNTKELHIIKFLQLFEQYGLDKNDIRFSEHAFKTQSKQVVWNYLVDNGYILNAKMLDKVKSKIELNKKTFYKLFLEPLTQNNYTKQSIWNLREIKIKDGNSIVEFTSFLIEKNWDINLEHLSSQESECAQGLIFYALDEHYTNCLKFKPEEITPELTALYKKVAKQTNLNQMPCGNPLYFEAFDTLTQLDIKAKETLDFSLKNYDNNNFLAFKVRYAPSTYEKEYKDYLFNLTKCLFHPINVNEKNNNGHSFANYALSLFLACFGSSFFDDNIKTHKKEIINLVDTMFTNHYIDLNSTFNDNETLEKKLNKSHLNNEGKILIEKWQLDNKLNTIQESKVGKKLKI